MENSTRQAKRAPVTLKIKFKSETLAQFIERYAVDVSPGGIFIRTKEPLAVGTPMKFEFQLRDATPLITGEGTVVWTRENDPARPNAAPGMGVRFDRLGEGSQPILDKILAEKNKQANPPQQEPQQRLFTDAPTRVAPSPLVGQLIGESKGKLGEMAPPRAGFGDERTDTTPLPRPMPFHTDAEEFPDETFEEATKVRTVDDLIAATAQGGPSKGPPPPPRATLVMATPPPPVPSPSMPTARTTTPPPPPHAHGHAVPPPPPRATPPLPIAAPPTPPPTEDAATSGLAPVDRAAAQAEAPLELPALGEQGLAETAATDDGAGEPATTELPPPRAEHAAADQAPATADLGAVETEEAAFAPAPAAAQAAPDVKEVDGGHATAAEGAAGEAADAPEAQAAAAAELAARVDQALAADAGEAAAAEGELAPAPRRTPPMPLPAVEASTEIAPAEAAAEAPAEAQAAAAPAEAEKSDSGEKPAEAQAAEAQAAPAAREKTPLPAPLPSREKTPLPAPLPAPPAAAAPETGAFAPEVTARVPALPPPEKRAEQAPAPAPAPAPATPARLRPTGVPLPPPELTDPNRKYGTSAVEQIMEPDGANKVLIAVLVVIGLVMAAAVWFFFIRTTKEEQTPGAGSDIEDVTTGSTGGSETPPGPGPGTAIGSAPEVPKDRVIHITSKPSGAEVRIDGELTGKKTPTDIRLSVRQAAQESIVVTLQKSGYQPSDRKIGIDAFVEEGQDLAVAIDVQLIPGAGGGGDDGHRRPRGGGPKPGTDPFANPTPPPTP